MGTFLKNLQGAACVLALGSGGVVFAQVAPGWSERGDYRAPVEEWEQQLAMLLSPVILPEPITATLPDGREAVFKFVQRIIRPGPHLARTGAVELRRVVEGGGEEVLVVFDGGAGVYNALFSGSRFAPSNGSVFTRVGRDGEIEYWVGDPISAADGRAEADGLRPREYASELALVQHPDVFEAWESGGWIWWRHIHYRQIGINARVWRSSVYSIPADFSWERHGVMKRGSAPPVPPMLDMTDSGSRWRRAEWPSQGKPWYDEAAVCIGRPLVFVPRVRMSADAAEATISVWFDPSFRDAVLKPSVAELPQEQSHRVRLLGPGPFGAVMLPSPLVPTTDFPNELAPALVDAASVDMATIEAWIASDFPPAISLAIYELDRRGDYRRLLAMRGLLADERPGLLMLAADWGGRAFSGRLRASTLAQQLAGVYALWFRSDRNSENARDLVERWAWLDAIGDPDELIAPVVQHAARHYEPLASAWKFASYVPAAQTLPRDEILARVEALPPARRAIAMYLIDTLRGAPERRGPDRLFTRQEAVRFVQGVGLDQIQRHLVLPASEGGEPALRDLGMGIEWWLNSASP